MKISLLALALSGLALSSSCASRRPPPKTSTAVESSGGGDVFAAPVAVRLVDAGAAPQTTLRYRLREGERQTAHVLLWIGATATADEGMAEMQLPPIVMEVESGPVERVDDELVRYALHVTDASVRLPEDADPSVQEQLDGELAALRGLDVLLTLDARGITHKTEMTPPVGIPRRVLAMLGNIRTSLVSVPLPREPVGAGARWEVVRQLDLDGFPTEQRVLYTLAAADERGAALEVSVHRSAVPQNLPEGRLSAFEAIAVGTVNVSFDRAMPHSEADWTTQMLITQPATGEHTRVRTRTFVRIAGERPQTRAPTQPEPDAAAAE